MQTVAAFGRGGRESTSHSPSVLLLTQRCYRNSLISGPQFSQLDQVFLLLFKRGCYRRSSRTNRLNDPCNPSVLD